MVIWLQELADGHKIVYEREVPFELRIQEASGPQEVGTLEAVRVKLLLLVSFSIDNRVLSLIHKTYG